MSDYDYTRDDASTSDIDNFEIPDVSAPSATAEQIENDNNFEIPPGDHTLVVTGFNGLPELKPFSVLLNGRTVSYSSMTIQVRFGLPFNTKKNVTDFFVLPPANPGELDAYYNGVPLDAKAGVTGGLSASKFFHFISRLGFPYPPGGKLPEAARRLGNWKGRTIKARVEAGKDWIGRDGAVKKGYSRIKFWSYMATDGSAAVGPNPSVSAAQGQRREPAMSGAGSANPSGLDNI